MRIQKRKNLSREGDEEEEGNARTEEAGDLKEEGLKAFTCQSARAMTLLRVRATGQDCQEHPTKSLDSEIKHAAALSTLTASNAIGGEQVQARSHGTRLVRSRPLGRIGMPRHIFLAAPRPLSHA